MFADGARFDLDRAALLGEYHRAGAQAAPTAAARSPAGAAAGGGCDDRALRKRDESLERLLLRRKICFRCVRVRGGAYSAANPRERGRRVVPIGIKIVSRRGGEAGDGERTVRNRGCGAVG